MLEKSFTPNRELELKGQSNMTIDQLPTPEQVKELQNKREQEILDSLRLQILNTIRTAFEQQELIYGWEIEQIITGVPTHKLNSFVSSLNKELKDKGIDYVSVFSGQDFIRLSYIYRNSFLD